MVSGVLIYSLIGICRGYQAQTSHRRCVDGRSFDTVWEDTSYVVRCGVQLVKVKGVRVLEPTRDLKVT